MPRLYFPDRYTRYSMAVLLVLFFASNWQRVFELSSRPWLRRTAYYAVMAFALVSFSDTFKPCDGDRSLDVWMDKGKFAQLSRTIAALPSPVLVASHPYTTSDVLVQARQPVLVIHRMFHYWFSDYHREIHTRIQDTFRALLADTASEANGLADRYGVTHLVIPKWIYSRSLLVRGAIYRPQFREFIAELYLGSSGFVLNPPPESSVLFEDSAFWLVKLPLEVPEPAGEAEP
jgi:hypothetical protein